MSLAPHLDPKKTRDDYLAAFFGELGKVRVPTGEGEALKKALERVSTFRFSELPDTAGIATRRRAGEGLRLCIVSWLANPRMGHIS